jgi:hypothetical protein
MLQTQNFEEDQCLLYDQPVKFNRQTSAFKSNETALYHKNQTNILASLTPRNVEIFSYSRVEGSRCERCFFVDSGHL